MCEPPGIGNARLFSREGKSLRDYVWAWHGFCRPDAVRCTMTSVLPSELAADLLARGHTARLRAGGGSMRPWIRSGATLVLVPVADPAALRVGEVVMAICDGRPTLHRVVRPAPDLRLKGDALGHLDPPPSAILGRVEGSGGRRDRAIARLSLALGPVQRVLILFGCLIRARRPRKTSA